MDSRRAGLDQSLHILYQTGYKWKRGFNQKYKTLDEAIQKPKKTEQFTGVGANSAQDWDIIGVPISTTPAETSTTLPAPTVRRSLPLGRPTGVGGRTDATRADGKIRVQAHLTPHAQHG